MPANKRMFNNCPFAMIEKINKNANKISRLFIVLILHLNLLK